ncbi:Serine/threonine-protein phosphatase dullard-like family protein [Trichuris suis]|nr:Serine/threonine-protein phosphatase dullard-like family protein [Trichuris suis]
MEGSFNFRAVSGRNNIRTKDWLVSTVNSFVERLKQQYQFTYSNVPVSVGLSAQLEHVQTKILVLDLDETLVHSCYEILPEEPQLKGYAADLVFYVPAKGRKFKTQVYKRPYVDAFLDMVSKWYLLVIYTAAMEEYADPIINMLDRSRGILNTRLYRRHCRPLNVSLTKDLRIVCNDLRRICIIDNSPTAYLCYPQNAVPIKEWTGNRNDTALLDLLPFLDCLRFCSDVRSILRRGSERRSIVPIEKLKRTAIVVAERY